MLVRQRARRRAITALVLGLAAVVAAGCGGDDDGSAATTTTTAGTGETDDGGELVALSYNVAGLPDVLSDSNPEANTRQIGPLLDDYDLVLLQESWKTPDPNPLEPTRVYHEILEETASHEHMAEMATQPLGSDPSRPEALLADGLGFFSRYPMTDVVREAWEGCFGGADTSDGGAGDCLAFKGMAMVTVTLPDGTEVDVYNLHAEAGSTEEDQRLQREDFDQLAAFVAEHSDGRPVILGGDTNLHTEDDPENPQDVEDSEIWEEFLSTTGMTDVCDTLDCPEPGRIDKFAFRSDDDVELEPTSWNFETEVFQDDAGEPLSDHDALAVRFTWSTASG
ncbi:MAG: endonuclease/exonuclease/phosphatase family protein [Acidimicrobiia bacterium]|nr:endonuclease/exonuclease/phosphatase family protein [Acidimicrobiia bacterium]